MNNKTDKVLVLNPRHLVSLWDMIDYWAGSFLPIWKRLDEHLCSCRKASQSPYIGDGSREDMKRILEDLKPHLYAADLMQADGRLRHFYLLLESSITPAVLQSEIEGLQKAIEWELADRKFAFIPTNKATYFENENLFEDLHQSLSVEINAEIKDAGNCLAADLNTAAVFHLMRVAEVGLRKLAKPFGIKLPHRIEFATWGEVLRAIQTELDKPGVRRSKSKEKKLQRYSHLLLDIKAFQHLWRNPVSHLRGRYDALQAQSAFNHVRSFMQKLAE